MQPPYGRPRAVIATSLMSTRPRSLGSRGMILHDVVTGDTTGTTFGDDEEIYATDLSHQRTAIWRDDMVEVNYGTILLARAKSSRPISMKFSNNGKAFMVQTKTQVAYYDIQERKEHDVSSQQPFIVDAMFHLLDDEWVLECSSRFAQLDTNT